MKKFQRAPMDPPSFSSSLLEAVYRSIDESDGGSPRHLLPSTIKKQIKPIDQNWPHQASTLAHLRRPRAAAEDRSHRRLFSISSSSDCSSFGGFSSSDAESSQKKRPKSIRTRLRNLQNLGNAPSPGNRVSAFLNAIFTAGGKSKNPKFAGGEEESETSSVRSFTRKTPASSKGEKQRSVRFAPSVEAGRPTRSRDGDLAASRRSRQMVEELLRRIGMEDEEDSDCESVSSSELFELDSLSVVGRRFKDELPVYETTNLGANRAIAHGFIV